MFSQLSGLVRGCDGPSPFSSARVSFLRGGFFRRLLALLRPVVAARFSTTSGEADLPVVAVNIARLLSGYILRR